MRIVLASQEFPPETAHGGIATQTFIKAHGLAALGNEVTVLSHSVDDARRDHREGSVRIIRLPAGAAADLDVYTEPTRWLTYSSAVAAQIARLHAEKSIDVIDFPEYGAEGYVHLLNRTEFNYIPVVVHLHGPLAMLAETLGWPEKGSDLYSVGTQMEGYCLHHADLVVSSSACSAQWAERAYGIPASAIPVVHAGIDTKRFAPMDVPRDERPTVVFVGKLAPNKGLSILVEACLRLRDRHPSLRLSVIGPRDDLLERDLLAQMPEGDADDLVEFKGFLPHDRLPIELNAADVFAAPSEYEGGPGFVYLEAMSCGLPVIAAEGSGAAEVVGHGSTGLLVPPRDPAALAEALHGLLSNERKRESLGKAARRFVEREAQTDAQIARLEAIYRKVVHRAAGPLEHRT